MAVRLHILKLKDIASPSCEILNDPANADFQEFSKRWTDIDRKIPAAIVLPREEEDICKIVKWAIDSSTPFVAKAGGCSEWSTIGEDGFVIDLTRYSSVEVDRKAQTAIIKGGVVQKEVAVRLAEVGLFTGEECSLTFKMATVTLPRFILR